MEKNIFESKNVLLVDDDLFIRQILHRQLTDIGFNTVVSAKDVPDALNQMHDSVNLDVIVLDLEMPEISGLTLLKAIREGKTRYSTNIPVLILTGHTERETVQKAIEIGINGYIAKPTSTNVLRSHLLKAIGS